MGADLFHSAEESDLLAALERLERLRNRLLEVTRAYERKRLRRKLRGRRSPSKAEAQALADTVETVKRAAGMAPSPADAVARH